MPGRCAVPHCDSQKGGFRFPQKKEQRKKWIQAVKRVTATKKSWTPSRYDVVCSEHFVDDDYREQKPFGKGRRRLKADAVPSVFPFTKPVSESQKARSSRAEKRKRKNDDEAEKVQDQSRKRQEKCPAQLDNNLCVGAYEVVGEYDSTETSTNTIEESEVPRTVPRTSDPVPESSPVKSDEGYRIEKYIGNDEAIRYLTGFDSYDHFLLLFNILGPACFQLKYKSKELDPKNELFLTLVKLRHGKDDFGLGLDFGLHRNVVARITRTWINFLYYELTELDFWLDRETIDQHFPTNFQTMFPHTRVILDATEVPVQKPSHCDGQRVTFSTYKNTNTLKTMIGITPRGVVSYTSASYGGSASDRQIIERSPLVKPGMLESGDAIMSDRGIMVQDLFASSNVKVNTPTTMKGRTQLDAETVIRDRRVASKRIHVERVIGYAKTFKILKKTLKHEKICMGSRIARICFLLTNFRESIIGKRA